MKKTMMLAASAAAILCMPICAAAADKPAAASHATTKATPFAHSPTNRGLSVLYDQSGDDSGIGVVSQDFETDFDAYDAQGADDFTIPGGTIWTIREVDVTGVYFNGPGPARSVNVIFYKHGRKVKTPGAIVREYDGIVPADNGTGSFVITLPRSVSLRAGTFWISVVANMDFATGGEWGWESQNGIQGSPALWQNPGVGFGTCPSWAPEGACVGTGTGDKMFTLKGISFP
jgi:hypothetical protein